ncbi:MAG: hypothetical protein K0U98_07200 [Deltaproteobacteria bacterium]|nr:hypothetical protein [Deltaproteobacteria bacterium]
MGDKARCLGSLLCSFLVTLPATAGNESRNLRQPCFGKHLEEKYFVILEKASEEPKSAPLVSGIGKPGSAREAQRRALEPSEGAADLVELHECAYRAGVKTSTVIQILVNVAKRISPISSPHCLSSMIALQQDAYASLLEQGNHWRATEALEVQDRLLRLLVRSQSDLDTHSRAARLLSRLALMQRLQHRLTPARRTLLRSIELDPHDAAQWLHLGLLEEKFGEYSAAEKSFLRWLDLDPEDPEPRLRLALTQGRLGKEERSRQGLAELWQGDAPAWIRVVALQELAQSLVREGQEGRAQVLLLQGLLEFPGEAGLRILLLSLGPTGEELPVSLVRSFHQPEELMPSERRSFRLEYNQWSMSKMVPHLEAISESLTGGRECLRLELPRLAHGARAGWPHS